MDRANEIILDLLFQHCTVYGDKSKVVGCKIDNHCLSANEEACAYLEEEGILYSINGRLYEVIKDQV